MVIGKYEFVPGLTLVIRDKISNKVENRNEKKKRVCFQVLFPQMNFSTWELNSSLSKSAISS